jgi:polar amino acid transport system substrate-binding protein
VRAGTKKAINYAVGIAAAAGLLAYLLLPVAPARVEYASTTSNHVDVGTFYLTNAAVTVGQSADIVPNGMVAAGTAPLVAAKITWVPSGSGAGVWKVASADASTAVTVNGAPAQDVALTDGVHFKVGLSELTFFAGRAGIMGFLDRIESDPTTHLFISPHVIAGAFPVVLKAFPVSVSFGVLAFIFAIPFGLGLAFMKMARTRWFRWPATLYVDVVRGTPLFLQILIVFFLIPLFPFYKDLLVAAPWINDPGPLGVSGSYWMRGLIVLSFNSAAYMAEIFRAGIQSISKGQSEAARSLGMTAVQSMTFVILPQTVRRILPTMMSEFILLFKDTAMLSAAGLAEMVLRSREVAASTFNASAYMIAAVFYLVLTIPLGRFVQSLENRLALSEGGGGAAVKADPSVLVAIDSEHVIGQPGSLPEASRSEALAGQGHPLEPVFRHDKDGQR